MHVQQFREIHVSVSLMEKKLALLHMLAENPMLLTGHVVEEQMVDIGRVMLQGTI